MGYFSILFTIITLTASIYGCNIHIDAGNLPFYTSNINNINGVINCGSLVCPKDSVNCEIITKNDPNNSKIVVTEEICSDINENVLDQKTFKTDNPSGRPVNITNAIGPKYREHARQQAQLIQQTVQNHIDEHINNNPIFNAWSNGRFL
ncbi:uncharacterized protein LOC129610465 [Condylostylus longicornis]|uniref:uncharacterized protein LOC129610465 n=1 Tax=Condylostylus longicornis TaxID=2530218 RepID=UPI00244E51D1|nr:uncharacterized protein LOC129610465 [Condylostylus longicornis]